MLNWLRIELENIDIWAKYNYVTLLNHVMPQGGGGCNLSMGGLEFDFHISESHLLFSIFFITYDLYKTLDFFK